MALYALTTDTVIFSWYKVSGFVAAATTHNADYPTIACV